MNSHFVYGIVDFPTNWARSRVWNMFIFYMIGKLLNMFTAVWTHPRPILVTSWKAKLSMKIFIQ